MRMLESWGVSSPAQMWEAGGLGVFTRHRKVLEAAARRQEARVDGVSRERSWGAKARQWVGPLGHGLGQGCGVGQGA